MVLGYQTGPDYIRGPEIHLFEGSSPLGVLQVLEWVLRMPYWQTRPTCVVVGTPVSAKMSSKVSLLTVGGLSMSGTLPVLDAAPLTVFMGLGSWSITSHLSWAKS